MFVCVCGQLRKVERDKKTMDQEIVDLTNKLLDAKNTIDHLEELNVSPPSLSLGAPPPLSQAHPPAYGASSPLLLFLL